MLEGRLVVLQPLSAEDVTDEYVGWFNDPETFRYLGTKFGQTRASIRKYIEQLSAPNLICRILEKTSLRHIGNITLHEFDPISRRMELGIVIGAPDARGKGFGREACSLLAAFGFDHLNLHKITAGTVVDNVGMTRVFESLGFKIEGTLAEHYYLEGRFRDMLRFGLLQRNFTPSAVGASVPRTDA
jgi:RimJ/RimL family protein N-acetyltransferase